MCAATVKFAARFAIFSALFEAFADLKKYFEGQKIIGFYAWVLSFEIAYATLDTYINFDDRPLETQFVYELKMHQWMLQRGCRNSLECVYISS